MEFGGKLLRFGFSQVVALLKDPWNCRDAPTRYGGPAEPVAAVVRGMPDPYMLVIQGSERMVIRHLAGAIDPTTNRTLTWDCRLIRSRKA